MELEESHVQFPVVKRDFFGDAFLEVFRQYNNALFDSVRLMIRYEKSLKAWREIVATVAKGDYSYLREGRRDWFRAMPKACGDTPLGKKLCDVVDVDLYRGADATHFRELHGSGMHDLSQSLVSGLNQTISPVGGITMLAHIEVFDLGKELEVLDRQRRRIQKAYLLFGDYGDALYEG